MIPFSKTLAGILLGLPLLFVTWRFAARIIGRIYRFPMPEFMADVIDNPLRAQRAD